MAFLSLLPSEFNPLFRILDDYDDACCSKPPMEHLRPSHLQHTRSFAPRFDIRESDDGYHLDGELPGVNQDNIDIAFTDPQTLVIKGSSQRNFSSSLTEPHQPGENPSESDSENTSKSLQPTVEDEEASGTVATAPTPKHSEVNPEPSHDSECKYWVSERSIGEFHRTFTFPTRVDRDAVRASLRNGILSIVVPKELASEFRKIRIE